MRLICLLPFFPVVMATTLVCFAALDDGLVAYYPLNGDATDASGRGAHGSNHTGTVQYQAGKHGLAAWFDGQSSIRLPQPRLLDGASNATISAWIYFATFTEGQIVASGDGRTGQDPISTRITPAGADDLHFQQVFGGGQIAIGFGGAAFSGLSVGAWHLFTVVLERHPTQSVYRIYVDAQLVKSTVNTQFTHIAYDTDMPPLIGAIQVHGPWQFWNGGIDELRIYDRALSWQEVAELFYSGNDPHLTIGVSDVLLCWNAKTNVVWQLQYRSELTGDAWVDLGNAVEGNGNRICVTNSVLDHPRKFYRVVPADGAFP